MRSGHGALSFGVIEQFGNGERDGNARGMETAALLC